MNTSDVFLWAIALVVLGTSVVLSIISARIRSPLVGAVGVVPVAIGLTLGALGLTGDDSHPLLAASAAILIFLLGTTAGGPITLVVLRLAGEQSVVTGQHGGIVPAVAEGEDTGEPREVLRGGATIGYLERIAVLGCLAAGRVEGLAVIVAIKGLGRFSELDSPEARERFIIGTLVSLIWAGACGALLLQTIQR